MESSPEVKIKEKHGFSNEIDLKGKALLFILYIINRTFYRKRIREFA
jgi:hypothetical protein